MSTRLSPLPGLWGFVCPHTHGLRRGLLPFAPTGAGKLRNIKKRKHGTAAGLPRLRFGLLRDTLSVNSQDGAQSRLGSVQEQHRDL